MSTEQNTIIAAGPKLRLSAVVMLRNDGDIVLPFLRQCAEFFDEIFVADVQATDGTGEVLRSFNDPRLKLHVYSVSRQERYQGALMNLLSRQAFARGADWVFCLDGDEFLRANSRVELEKTLVDLGADIMMMPWINLVPTRFGDFSNFDAAQLFHWSGRTSGFSKIAISSLYAANNSQYHIEEGNHSIRPSFGKPEVFGQPGLPLLHLPIRSLERLKYKNGMAHRLVGAKHNRISGEGTHVDSLHELLTQGSIATPELRHLAATYGSQFLKTEPLDPEAQGWPSHRLPAFIHEAHPSDKAVVSASLPETLIADALTTWDLSEFIKGSRVGALIEGEQIRIAPLAVAGSGIARTAPFAALPPTVIPERFSEDWLTDLVATSCTPIHAWVFSAWTQLVPVMYSLFSLLRPRRYVELGVHNGMSFFAACQITEKLGVPAELVAVDSWIGDVHASFHDSSVFDNFHTHLAEHYPSQYFLRSYFAAALSNFEDGSIDLLHIDGLHTYEAVKDDFETWLPKMSEAGVIIFHDTNEFGRGFGVWRLWEELKKLYPAFEFSHQHGLGIIFVGREPHPFANLLRHLSENRRDATLAQTYFEAIGTLLTEQRALVGRQEAEHTQNVTSPDHHSATASPPLDSYLDQQNLAQQYLELQGRLNAVVSSTTWRLTAPLRAVLSRLPALRLFLRRSVKSVWWLLTGQLPARYRMFRAAQAEAARRQGS